MMLAKTRSRRLRNAPRPTAGLPYSEPERIVDKAYRDSARGRTCDVPGCGNTETVVGAHLRLDGAGGTACKPCDVLMAFLCHDHHELLDGRAGPVDPYQLLYRWFVVPMLEHRYTKWKRECWRE